MKLFFLPIIICCSLSAKKVYVDLVADLCHRGHVELMKKAKAEGDYLLVGIHSDEDVMTYKRRPVMNMKERMEAVEALGIADKVIGHAPLHITKEYLDTHEIDLVIHGDDISEENMKKMYGVPIALGKFKLVPYTDGISSTMLIKRLENR